MKKQAFQHGEIRDQNDTILQDGAYGKKTAFTNGQNMGILDYIINNLEVLYDGLIAAGLVIYDEDGKPVLPDEIKTALQGYVTSAGNSATAADASAKAAAGSAAAADGSARAAAGSEANADTSAKAAATSEKNSLENANAAANSKAAADTSAQAAAGSAATAQAGANTATEQANLAKQYKEEMFNGTPEGFADLIDKVDALAEESIGSFRAINGKIHIKTA